MSEERRVRYRLRSARITRVLRAPLHQDVSNRGGIQGSSCGNIPRLVELSRRIRSWSGEACQSVRLFDRPTMPDLSSLHPPRVPYCSCSAKSSGTSNHHKAYLERCFSVIPCLLSTDAPSRTRSSLGSVSLGCELRTRNHSASGIPRAVKSLHSGYFEEPVSEDAAVGGSVRFNVS